ncbi:hypothetical protein MRX96_010976 [Rhipicephalus microplus]
MGPKAEGGGGVVLGAELGEAPALANDAPVRSFEWESRRVCCGCGEEVGGKQTTPSDSGKAALFGGHGLRDREKVGKARVGWDFLWQSGRLLLAQETPKLPQFPFQ